MLSESQRAAPVLAEQDSAAASAPSDRDVALRVSNVSKCYQIFARPHDRLKQSLVPRFQRLLGLRPKLYAREFWALSNISFDIQKGETVGIIGRNGSGKSTLLQIICGTLAATSGEVETNGRIAALLELGSGFNPEFTGRENVYLNASILGLNREEIHRRFDDIAAFAEIGEFIEQPVKTYSSGMAVRLAFAVIAHVDADILVIDEALAVGDVFFVQKCMRFLRSFMKRGTIFFVSHDIGAVVNLCQRAVWLDKGTVRAIGTPKEISDVYLADLAESRQGGSPARARQLSPLREGVGHRLNADQRLRYVNASPLRNDIELFRFDPNAPAYGLGGASIIQAQLHDSSGEGLSWCVGGEAVMLRIRCLANRDVTSPIIGFFVKDRLGQPLFGENTYLTCVDSPVHIPAGECFEGIFEFRMPVLPVGDYSFCIALAEGTQDEHVQHHWIHDAFVIRSHSTSVSTGLVGIPIDRIEVRPVPK